MRVCDSCFEKYGPRDTESPTGESGPTIRVKRESESELPAEYLASPLSKQPQVPDKAPSSGGKSEAELREEEELQLALAISQSEAAVKKSNDIAHDRQQELIRLQVQEKACSGQA